MFLCEPCTCDGDESVKGGKSKTRAKDRPVSLLDMFPEFGDEEDSNHVTTKEKRRRGKGRPSSTRRRAARSPKAVAWEDEKLPDILFAPSGEKENVEVQAPKSVQRPEQQSEAKENNDKNEREERKVPVEFVKVVKLMPVGTGKRRSEARRNFNASLDKLSNKRMLGVRDERGRSLIWHAVNNHDHQGADMLLFRAVQSMTVEDMENWIHTPEDAENGVSAYDLAGRDDPEMVDIIERRLFEKSRYFVSSSLSDSFGGAPQSPSDKGGCRTQ